jgi:hypothetical protein
VGAIRSFEAERAPKGQRKNGLKRVRANALLRIWIALCHPGPEKDKAGLGHLLSSPKTQEPLLALHEKEKHSCADSSL